MPTSVMKRAPDGDKKPPKSAKTGDKPDGLRSIQVNPIAAIAGAVVLVAALAWFLWLGPKVQADKAARDWVTPQAAAARAPGGQPRDAAHEATVQKLRAKEGSEGRARQSRRDN